MFTIIAIYGKGYGVSTANTPGAANRLFELIRNNENDVIAVFMYGPTGELITATNVKIPG